MLREIFGSPKPSQNSQAKNGSGKPTGAPQQAVVRPDSVLGARTQLVGTLKAEGNVRIEGIFCGDVSTTGRIVVGEQGKVEGNLVGDSVDVAGTVTGDVVARRVGVSRSGRILGDLRLEKLVTEEGGFIQGLVHMEEKVEIADYLPASEQPDVEPVPVKKEEAQPATTPEKVKVSARSK